MQIDLGDRFSPKVVRQRNETARYRLAPRLCVFQTRVMDGFPRPPPNAPPFYALNELIGQFTPSRRALSCRREIISALRNTRVPHRQSAGIACLPACTTSKHDAAKLTRRRDAPVLARKRAEGPVRKGRTLHRGRFHRDRDARASPPRGSIYDSLGRPTGGQRRLEGTENFPLLS